LHTPSESFVFSRPARRDSRLNLSTGLDSELEVRARQDDTNRPASARSTANQSAPTWDPELAYISNRIWALQEIRPELTGPEMAEYICYSMFHANATSYRAMKQSADCRSQALTWNLFAEYHNIWTLEPALMFTGPGYPSKVFSTRRGFTMVRLHSIDRCKCTPRHVDAVDLPQGLRTQSRSNLTSATQVDQ
jgi:hypothetical protein